MLALLLLLVASPVVMAADSAFVAGATGGTGRLIVDALLAQHIPVRAMTRDPEKAAAAPGVTWVAGDVTRPETLAPALGAARIVISAIGARDMTGANSFEFVDWGGNRALIDAAKAAHVRQVLLITSGSAGDEVPQGLRSPTIRPSLLFKAKAEAYLRASGLPYTIVAPGGLRDTPGGQAGLRLLPRSGYQLGVVARADVATLAVACTLDAACLGKTITVVNDPARPVDAWRAILATLPADTPATIRAPAPN